MNIFCKCVQPIRFRDEVLQTLLVYNLPKQQIITALFILNIFIIADLGFDHIGLYQAYQLLVSRWDRLGQIISSKVIKLTTHNLLILMERRFLLLTYSREIICELKYCFQILGQCRKPSKNRHIPIKIFKCFGGLDIVPMQIFSQLILEASHPIAKFLETNLVGGLDIYHIILSAILVSGFQILLHEIILFFCKMM